MTKYVPKKLTQLSANESAAVDIINQNLDSIKEHIDDSLSRTAKSPSQMQAALDMNGQKILNLGVPTEDTDVVRLKDVIENKEEIKQLVNTASVAVEKAMEAAETAEEAAEDMSDQIQLAKDWATKTSGPVEDGEYSSKYYAENIGADVHTVADIATDVTTVAGSITNINAVVSDMSNVNAVAGDLANIDTVASNGTDIDTVATNISDVNTCAANMSAIQDAPTQAANAAASAVEAHNNALSCAPILFDHKWTDYEVNNESWLRADTYSWQDGTVYTNAYQHLLDDIDGKTATTETVAGTTVTYYLANDGHKIVKVDDVAAIETVYTAIGVAWYYVLDETNQRFKLPRENPAREELIQSVRAKGNRMALGITDGSALGGLAKTSGHDLVANSSHYGSAVGTAASGGSISEGKVYGITTDSTKSGIISDMTDSTSVYKGKQYLYFYVGQFTQTATEQTAGLNSELFNGKVDLNASNLSTQGKSLISGLSLPSTRYDDLTVGATGSTYNAPANGWFIAKAIVSTNAFIELTNHPTGASMVSKTPNGGTIAAYIPALAGEEIALDYTAINSWIRFRFVYAEGEENV